MPCDEQMKAYIRERGHGDTITVLTFLKASQIEEEIK